MIEVKGLDHWLPLLIVLIDTKWMVTQMAMMINRRRSKRFSIINNTENPMVSQSSDMLIILALSGIPRPSL